LGIAFPERGVVLSLDLNDASAVTQATVEPVSFHAFLMRAEATWHEDYTGALADVSTVMELDANQPQAYWIRAKILNALGRSEEALQSIREASRLVPDTPEYMLTEAAILIHQGHIQLAKDLAAETVRVSDQLPELKAQAMVFQGNLLRDDGPTGGRQAMDLHMQAIEAAKTMINDPRVTIRRAARDAYLDAHLAIAEDIASGTFRNQAEAAGQWIARAMALAEGAEPSRQREKSFQVASQALHVLARMQSPPNPEEWARQTLTFGRDLLANVQDPLCQQRISWELATALSAGVKIHRKRDEATDALQLAQLADKYFSDAGPDRGRDGREALQIGLFRFQAGSVEALLNDNHEAAVKWFEASRANFAQTPQRLTERMDSEYGQILVSMAVSYWELGQSEAALQLMTEGAGFMEAAVKGGRLESKALGAPYFNLAVMHRHLGKEQEAARFDELARNVGVETGAVR
jgi:tetratricopeptide (TPR) repeat protein